MDVGTAVIAHAEATVAVVQPAEAALDGPALGAQPGAMLGGVVGRSAARDLRCDPAGAQLGLVMFAVVRAVCVELGRAKLAVRADRRNLVDQGQQLRDVVAVGGGQRDREGNAVAADDQVMFAARSRPVDRRGAGFFAPPLALT